MSPPLRHPPSEEGRLSTPDGLALAWYRWHPSGERRATVVLTHGHGEHAARYSHVAGAMTRAGLEVIAFDVRGHGQSDGPRGHAPGFGRLLEDLGLVLSMAARPRILYGHSMGGLLALAYSRHHPAEVDAVIATSPWLRLAFPAPPLKVAVGRALYRLAPSLRLATGLDQTAISRDPEVVAAYAADPLVHDRLSTRLGIDLLDVGARVIEQAPGLEPAVLLTHGDADRLTDAAATEAFYRAAGSKDKTFKLWPGRFHETHNDPEWEAVVAFSIEWALARIR